MEISIVKISLDPNAGGGGNSGSGGNTEPSIYWVDGVPQLSNSELKRICTSNDYNDQLYYKDYEILYYTDKMIWRREDTQEMFVPQYSFNTSNQQWEFAVDANGNTISDYSNILIDGELRKYDIEWGNYDCIERKNSIVKVHDNYLKNIIEVEYSLPTFVEGDENDVKTILVDDGGSAYISGYWDKNGNFSDCITGYQGETYKYCYNEVKGNNQFVYENTIVLPHIEDKEVETIVVVPQKTDKGYTIYGVFKDSYNMMLTANNFVITLDEELYFDNDKGDNWGLNVPYEFKNISCTGDTQYCGIDFSRCNKIKGIHINDIYIKSTNEVKGDFFTQMFRDCENLEYVEIDNCNYPAKYLNYAFRNCRSLKSAPKLYTGEIQQMQETFYGCSSLTDISAIKDWDISNVTSLSSTFNGCSSLTDISAIKDWNFSNITSMYYMLGYCTNLTSIPSIDCGKLSKKNYQPFMSWSEMKVTDIEGFPNMKMSCDMDSGLKKYPYLTYDSCINILNGLYDFVGNGETPTTDQGVLKVHQNFLDLVGTDIVIGTNKGWTITT